MHELQWSYSSLKTFQQCPKKYYHLRIKKDVVDAGNQYTSYGEGSRISRLRLAPSDLPPPIRAKRSAKKEKLACAQCLGAREAGRDGNSVLQRRRELMKIMGRKV